MKPIRCPRRPARLFSLLAVLTLAAVTAACGQPRTPADEARTLSEQSAAASARGDYATALSLAADAVEKCNKTYGEFSEPTGLAMHSLGVASVDFGDLTNGIGTLRRALQILERVKGREAAILAPTLDQLGRAYVERGNLAVAGPHLRRALKIRAATVGADHPDNAVTSYYLGRLAAVMNVWPMADSFYDVAQRYYEKSEGPLGYHLAAVLAGRAAFQSSQGDFAAAGQPLDKAIAIAERTRGSFSEEVAEYLTARADVFMSTNAYDRAMPLLLRAERILVRATNRRTARTAYYWQAAARELLEARGDVAHAQVFLELALSTMEKSTATNSAYTATILDHLVMVYWAKGDLARAVATFDHLEEVGEDVIVNAANAFSRAPENVRFQPLLARYPESWATVSLAFQAKSDAARNLALRTLLRRKGRRQELIGSEVRAIREGTKPEQQAAVGQYLTASRDLARAEFLAALDGKDVSPEINRARVEQDRSIRRILGSAEGDDEALNTAMTDATEHITIANVAESIPAGSALVEFTKYWPVDVKRTEAPARYAAFVLWKDGRTAMADLGEAQATDELVGRLRTALADPKLDPKPLARSLDERVMRPIRAMVGDTRLLILAPDDDLSLVPFGALIDESNEFLVKNWHLFSITTGRELVRLTHSHRRASGPALVVANPDFGPAPSASTRGFITRGADISALRRARFPELPGTADEGRRVATILGAELLSGAQAKREVIAGRRAPRVLHIATHGFFLNDPADAVRATRGLVLDTGSRAAPVEADALFRSGLVFAGANQEGPGLESILTAKEALALDLGGTELVVLSACETGLGESSPGQGVRGLQQAFIIAGARSLVMSLWKVDDAATRDLMDAFYAAIGQGRGPAAALRTAQLQMLADPARSHPYYWGSFIQYGDPSPLRSISAGALHSSR